MAATIYEPTLSREAACAHIERELRRLCPTASRDQTTSASIIFANLELEFFVRHWIAHFTIRLGSQSLMNGDFDPRYPNSHFYACRWTRGRWEENFGIPVDAYDPHWDDRIPPILRQTMRRATSSPIGGKAAQQVLSLMTSFADGTFQDVLECTLNGDEHAGELACWTVNCMRGPNMATMVPLMLWVNGARPADVLRGYSEAHHKRDVRRRDLREILGNSKRVSDFFEYAIGADTLRSAIDVARSMPPDEAARLIDVVAAKCDPLIHQAFPEGIDSFLGRFISNTHLDFRRALAMRRIGLFG
jgi:hypothetical protein